MAIHLKHSIKLGRKKGSGKDISIITLDRHRAQQWHSVVDERERERERVCV